LQFGKRFWIFAGRSGRKNPFIGSVMTSFVSVCIYALAETRHITNETITMIDTESKEMVTLPLQTQITCPFHPEHKFALQEGLSRSTIDQYLANTEAVNLKYRKQIQIDLEKSMASKLQQEKDRMRNTLMEETEELNTIRREQEKVLVEMRNSLQRKSLSELKLKEQLSELKAAQEVAIAKALSAQKENIKEEALATVRESMEAEIQKERDETRLRILQLEKQRSDAERVAADLKRKISQGSMQIQGEVLELEVEEGLRTLFPVDNIEEVGKGVSGSDVVHDVRFPDGSVAGRISYECKNAKNWSPKWIEKLKSDQIRNKADLAVLITSSLPESIKDFGFVEGVWVCSIRVWRSLAAVLRSQLLQLHSARASAENRDSKMQAIYEHLVGPEFKNRVELMVSTFVAMKEQVERERRAFDKQWKARETQISTVTENVCSLFGGLQGVVGESALPAPACLSLESSDKE
jgi:hypothetical protein